MPSKIPLRDGKILLQRLGTLKPVKQGYWKRAPAREGLWAFPWPYFSMFFAAHQYQAIAPRRFSAAQSPADPNEVASYEAWFREVAPRVLPIRKFWYEGELYTHLTGRGHDLGLSSWERVDATEFADRARRFLVRRSRWRPAKAPVSINSFDIEALEIFVPTRGGHFTPAPGRWTP